MIILFILYKEVKDWGVISWIKPVLDFMMSGVSETIDFQLKQIFESVKCPNQYLRIETLLPKWCSPDMDNTYPDNLNALKEVGEDVVKKFDEKIDQFLDLLIEVKKKN